MGSVDMFGGTHTIFLIVCALLVIDDEAVIRQTIVWAAKWAGVKETLVASSGQAGIDLYKYRRLEIDAVLLDYNMEPMMGDEVFRILHKIDPELPIIMLSGHGRSVEKQLLLEGLKTYIPKPVDQVALRAALQKFAPNVLTTSGGMAAVKGNTPSVPPPKTPPKAL